MGDYRLLAEALEKLTLAQTRVVLLEALRDAHQKWPGSGYQVHGKLGDVLVDRLLPPESRGTRPQEAFLSAQQEPFMRRMMDAVWQLIRAGIIRPQSFVPSTGVLLWVAVTESGARFFANFDDHPMAPGFVQRLRTREPDMPEEVINLLEDVYACLEAGLVRPGVMLLGVTYEVAIDKVVDALAARAISVKKGDAGERIQALRLQVPKFDVKRDERNTLLNALDHADRVRARRNNASHPKGSAPFNDLEELEEILIASGRQLTVLWSMTTLTLAPTTPGAGGVP